jgi:hypothetical protein
MQVSVYLTILNNYGTVVKVGPILPCNWFTFSDRKLSRLIVWDSGSYVEAIAGSDPEYTMLG